MAKEEAGGFEGVWWVKKEDTGNNRVDKSDECRLKVIFVIFMLWVTSLKTSYCVNLW